VTSFAKFSGPDLDSSVEFSHPNVWQREEHPGWSRLIVGAREREVPLILELCRDLEGPFGILYVLLVPRLAHGAGRYQNPEPIEYGDLELFLHTFQAFLEQDGRHHLWVMSTSGDGQLIFDNHNIIYAYGDLERFGVKLAAQGFRPGPVEIPDPHSHNYHAAFDQTEDEILRYWQWKMFPLEPTDDP
jgi:hypothetical protein